MHNVSVTIHKADPDVIVGHEFLGVSLDVMLHRMRSLGPEHWSRIGRFRRSKWPNIGRQGTNLRFLSGRLLCDLASDGAKVCAHHRFMDPAADWMIGHDHVDNVVTH